MLYFAAYTINNLPLLFEIAVPDDKQGMSVVIKYTVPKLKPLVEDCVRFVLTKLSTSVAKHQLWVIIRYAHKANI